MQVTHLTQTERMHWWQVKLWHGALKWVALWLTLSMLTLLHAFGLVHSMANVSLAKVRPAALLFSSCLDIPVAVCALPKARSKTDLSCSDSRAGYAWLAADTQNG